jgi:hypothetical protein
MFSALRNFWNEKGLEWLTLLSIIFIIIIFLYNCFYNKKGTYSNPKRINADPSSVFDQSTEDSGFTSKLEKQSKIILENIFKKPFNRIRPNFLRNPVTDQNLEIDLYNDELKLGIEVNGNQHYKFTPFFQKNKESFYNQQYRDEIKKMKCKENGVVLIEIPHFVGEKGLKSYILKELRLNQYLL